MGWGFFAPNCGHQVWRSNYMITVHVPSECHVMSKRFAFPTRLKFSCGQIQTNAHPAAVIIRVCSLAQTRSGQNKGMGLGTGKLSWKPIFKLLISHRDCGLSDGGASNETLSNGFSCFSLEIALDDTSLQNNDKAIKSKETKMIDIESFRFRTKSRVVGTQNC